VAIVGSAVLFYMTPSVKIVAVFAPDSGFDSDDDVVVLFEFCVGVGREASYEFESSSSDKVWSRKVDW
jgi:hypothetical protein